MSLKIDLKLVRDILIALIAAVIADRAMLSQDIFPPATIAPTNLCATLLSPPLPLTPPFDFVSPLPPKVIPYYQRITFHLLYLLWYHPPP